jgi:hypothetical protein
MIKLLPDHDGKLPRHGAILMLGNLRQLPMVAFWHGHVLEGMVLLHCTLSPTNLLAVYIHNV